MLEDDLAIRVAAMDSIIPNIEIKFAKSDLDRISLNEHNVVVLDKDTLNISPMELQVAFKLYLGSDKDVEDAIYLYDIFFDYLDKVKLKKFMKILNVKGADYGIDV